MSNCVQCGYCCSITPCPSGQEISNKDHGCKYLAKPNELGQKLCMKYEAIKKDFSENLRSKLRDICPAFGAGCSSALFNTVRDAVIIKLKGVI